MLIYGRSEDFENSILSILFMEGKDDKRENTFIKNMNIDAWKYEYFN